MNLTLKNNLPQTKASAGFLVETINDLNQEIVTRAQPGNPNNNQNRL